VQELVMPERRRNYYAVTRQRGASWDASLGLREQDRWDEHAAYMDALAEERFVVLGGPLGDGSTFLLIISAESEQEIETRLADDPWTPMDLLRIARVDRWEILLGEP
jgi:uncharacterized protein YciI